MANRCRLPDMQICDSRPAAPPQAQCMESEMEGTAPKCRSDGQARKRHVQVRDVASVDESKSDSVAVT